ncbi:IS1634 family transposase, partial [Desulfobacterales bacterium HSG17]|nr:IS1634 family transposase [Desulfobacterales bacterium HSG17]
MYLRKTSRKNKDGSAVEYYQLAHNERHPVTRKPVAKIIHHFGRADKIDRDQLVRLCKSIARVCGLNVMDSFEEPGTKQPSDVLGFPKDLKLIGTRSLGSTWVIEALWEKLFIGKTLRDICKRRQLTVPYERALLALVANRLCEPQSKLGVWDRWLSKVFLPSCEGLKLDQMYEAMDLLHEHAEEIEKAIFFSTANLLNRTVDLIFYDTTTASFSIDGHEVDGIKQMGRPKEGGWTVQIVVALAVTSDGLPVRSWVFPGNTTDVDTISRVRADLRDWQLGRALFIADAGMNSETNRDELAKACGKYILACRMSSVTEIKNTVLGKRGRYTQVKDNLMAKEVIVGDGERRRRYILCYNPKEAERQKKHRQQILAMLETEIDKHPDKSVTAKWAIELLASKRFKRYLTISKSKKIRIDQAKVREAEKYDGKWVLQTNDDTISLEDAACGYRSLMVIERCFRSLKKTQIKITPMYHWLERRIEAHVKICVIALLIQRVGELECKMSWSQIRNRLEKLQVTEFFSIDHRFFRRNEMPPQVTEILKSL